MKRLILIATLVLGVMTIGVYISAEEHPAGNRPEGGHGVEEHQKSKLQTTCPVMGGKVDRKYYADHDGKRVYFCCSMCVDEFKKDPAKYIKKLEDQGVAPDRVPGT